jgi:disulfide bond formation protein DsbB
MGAKTPFFLALAILVTAVASIAGAFLFEAFGYAPCELCLEERIPYYAAIPIAGLALVFAARGSKTLLRAAFASLAVVFAASAVFGAYHAGVEWGFWPGPAECTGTLDRAASAEDFETIGKRQSRALRRGRDSHSRPLACGLERGDLSWVGGARRAWAAR